jgi:hypothetical protein
MLIWKEWQERKWQLALGAAWMLCGAVYVVWYESAHRVRAPVAGLYSVASMFGVLAAVLLAIRTAVGEKTQHTLGFSAAMPVSIRRQAWVRLAGAAITLAVPMLLGAAVLTFALGMGGVEQATPRSPEVSRISLLSRDSLPAFEAVGFLWRATALEISAAVTLLVFIVLLGALCRTESQVGFLGAFLGILSLTLSDFRGLFDRPGQPALLDFIGALEPQMLIVNYGYSEIQGSYGDLVLAPTIWGPLALNLLVLFGLGVLFARQYGRLSAISTSRRGAWRLWRPPAILSRLPFRWPGRLPALIWLDLRQAVPLALSGLGVACLITIIVLVTENRGPGPFVQQVAGQLPGGTWMVAVLWAAIVAAGVFSGELQPDLGAFWRSRPIGPAAWYWVKFVVGLVAVLAVLDGVTICVSWNSPYGSSPNQMSWSYVACMPLLHATIYAVTVLGVCWLRQPIYGAVAGVLTYVLLTTLIGTIPGAGEFDPLAVYNSLFQVERTNHVFNLRDHNYPIVYGTLAALTLAAALLALPAVLKPAHRRPIF